MIREVNPIYLSQDETGGSGFSGKPERIQPEVLNAHLRDLFGQLQTRLVAGPDQTAQAEAAEKASKLMERLGHLSLELSMEIQQHEFVTEAQFQSAKDILDVIRAGVLISNTSDFYKEYLLDHILGETSFDPEFRKKFPIDIDCPRYMWGVGKPGEPGIFAQDSARILEVAAYKSERQTLDLIQRGNPVAAGSKKQKKDRAHLSEWRKAIDEKYGPTPEADSTDYNFSGFYN